MAISGDFAKGLKDIITQLGTPATVEDTAGGVRNVRIAISTLGKEDQALINSLGEDARVIYAQTLNPRPAKFHRFKIQASNEVFVIHTSHNIIIDNVIVGHKFMVKG